MKKIVMILSLVLILGLLGCSMSESDKCVAIEGDAVLELEWRWNEIDGFTEFKTNGLFVSSATLDVLNEAIENSDFLTVAEFMDDFKVNAEAEGYTCE